MNLEEIQAQVQVIFRDILEIPDLIVSKELSAEHIPAWDSMRHLILIDEIERNFKVKFKLKELISMRNVGDMMRLIEEKLD